MKFTVRRDEFVAALQTVSKVTAARSPQAVLEGVRMTLGPKGLSLEATDLDVGIRAWVEPTEKEGGGDLLVLPSRLLQLLNELDDEELYFLSTETDLELKAKGGLFKFRRFGAEDFPELPAAAEEDSLALEAGPLKEMLDRTIFCAAKEKGRYALNSICFVFEPGVLEVVGTDGRRLGICRYRNEDIPERKKPTMLPVRLVELVRRELAHVEAEMPVKITIDDNRARFLVGDVLIVGRLTEGQYPNYRSVIPTKLDKEARVDLQELMRAVRIGTIFMDPVKKIATFQMGSGKIVMKTRLPEQGESVVEIPAKYLGDAEETLGFNPAYILDYLRAVSGREVIIRFKDSIIAAIFETADEPYEYKYILAQAKTV